MLIVLLLLSGSVSTGSSEDQYYRKYGAKISIEVNSRVHFITFIPAYSSYRVTVFSRYIAIAGEIRRGFLMGNRYVIDNLTQRDSGRYLLKDKAQNTLSTKSIKVTAHRWNVTLSPGEYHNVTFDLKPESCNIYFYTGLEYMEQFLLVAEGSLQEDYIQYCGELEFQWPCGILSENLYKSCSGRYEIRDNHDNEALVVYILSDSHDQTPYIIGISVAVIVLLFVLCCCVRRCRRKKSATKVDSPETAAAAEPAVHYERYEHEPVILSHMSQPPSEMHNPAQPSCAPTVPLMHNPPTMSSTPAYSEVVASTEQPDAPTLPLHSDPGPQFVVKGLTFPSAPLLGSDSACEVYTSEKLNFL